MTSTYHHYSNTNQQQIISRTSGRSNTIRDVEEDRNFTRATAPPTTRSMSTSTSTEWDWDFKLNTLLDDLQKSIRPLPTLYEQGNRVQILRDRDHNGDRNSRTSTTEEYSSSSSKEYKYKSPRTYGIAAKRDNSPKAKLIEIGQSLKESESAQSQSQPFYLAPRGDSRRSSSGSGNVKRSGQPQHPVGVGMMGYQPQMEYMDASNTVTILRSTESSPVPPPPQLDIRPGVKVMTSPIVERKEYYSSTTSTAYSSSTSKNIATLPSSPPQQQQHLDFIPPQNYPEPQNQTPRHHLYDDRINETEERVVYYKKPDPPAPASGFPVQQAIGQPLYSSTPIRNINQATPQRQTCQRNESYKTSCQTNLSSRTDDNFADYQEPPNDNRPIPTVDTPGPPKFYTATTMTTRTVRNTDEGNDTVDSPVPLRVFPTNGNLRGSGRGLGSQRLPNGTPAGIPQEPPKRLDQLLATFDESFVETSKIVGDGGGPHKSHPYGPGTYPIPRSVRIDESANIEKEIIEKYAAGLSSKSSHNNNNIMSYSNSNNSNGNSIAEREPIASATATASMAMAGPPVFYPIQPNEQLFSKTQSEMESHYGSNGHGKMKMDRKYETREKSKASRVEKGGGGAIPVPVCLPICCAAPCVIL